MARILPLAIPVFFAFTALGQDSSKILYFHGGETERDIQQITTVIRAVADVPQSTPDTVQRTLTLRGTAAQVAAGEWLFDELDKSANNPLEQQPADTAVHEYQLNSGPEGLIRVFYLKYAATLQDFQEAATLIRSIGQIRSAFTYSAPRALVVRGNTDQSAMAAWLVKTLGGAPQPVTSTLEFRVQGTNDDVVRVLYLPNTRSLLAFQEVATLMRSIGDIRYLFTYNTPHALALRGTTAQASLAQWLAAELEKPADAPPNSANREFHLTGTAENVVHLFYLPQTETVARFQQIVASIRKSTQISRAFTYNEPRALAVRGTPDQIALATNLVQEWGGHYAPLPHCYLFRATNRSRGASRRISRSTSNPVSSSKAAYSASVLSRPPDSQTTNIARSLLIAS